MPSWWNERRFGLLFEPSVAAVAGWAPIGTDAAAYRALLGYSRRPDSVAPSPMVEVLAHHRDRWGHVDDFDDFVELLDFASFEPAAWAQLAVDAGAGYAATVARHHDGWRWWDARHATRTLTAASPHADIVTAFADACAARDVVVGAYYSTYDGLHADALLTDPGRSGTESSDADHADVDEAATDLIDLTTRHRPAFIVLDGRAELATLIAKRITKHIVEQAPDLVVSSTARDITGPFPYSVACNGTAPDEIAMLPWQLQRAVGSGHGFNRADGAAHHLDAPGIVALLTEVLAKGGHLLLGVAVTADGVVADSHAHALRRAGRWIERNRALVDRAHPWHTWGDADVRYLVVDDVVHAVDVTGRGRFDALHRGAGRVTAVHLDGAPVTFHQSDATLSVDGPPGGLVRRAAATGVTVAVYAVTLTADEEPVSLFPNSPTPPIELGPLIADARGGAVVQLGDGRYLVDGTIPDGVILRGLGPTRTRLVIAGDARVVIGAGARLEHVAIEPLGENPLAPARDVLELAGPGIVVLGCTIAGTVVVQGDDTAIRATRVTHIQSDGVDRLTIARSTARGTCGAGITIRGGGGHTIESCEVGGHDHAVRLVDTSGVVVRANDLAGRRRAIWLERTDASHVQANFVKRSGRGIDVDGGVGAVIDGNAVRDGDSGAVVHSGATATVVTGNTWERCRVGVLTWDAGEVTLHANEGIDLTDADHVTGP